MRLSYSTIFVMLVLLAGMSAQAAITLDDCTTVVEGNHPGVAGSYDTWYDVTYNAYAACTLDAGRVRLDDGGYTNGIYIIYQAAVPADGYYTLSADLEVVEDAANPNGIRDCQIGVKPAGVHRGDGSTVLDACTAKGSYPGLTAGLDTLGVQTVTTDAFFANAGDDLVVALSSDTLSGAWNGNAGAFGTGDIFPTTSSCRRPPS